MANQTTSGKLGDLGRLSTALSENAVDFQGIAGAMAEFDGLVQQAQDAANRQAAFTASRLAATEELQGVLREASRLATGLRQQVKYRYGISSPKLAAFGMQPFRGRKQPDPVSPTEPEPVNPDGTPIEFTA
jgi:hypothetical protein